MRTSLKFGIGLVTLLVASSGASGYYHYIHFAGRTGPFVPIPEKYDLSALTNKTVYYFISDQGASQLAPGDTLAGLHSQIRLAAKAWNDVSNSDLRLAFGGVAPIGTPQNTPGIDVVFDDDIPPGVNALGGVQSIGAMATPSDGTPAFFPINRGVVKIRRDLSKLPSYAERLYATLVHEFGHSLGLQHTLTSAVMSTEVTRATTRSKPVADDDIAALAVLYPAAGFHNRMASVSGRVTMGGAGVNLASVVAISPNASAISTLTNPDGTYTLQGVPPGNYYVYVHPLPPAYSGEDTPANIKPPQDNFGTPLPMSGFFTTQFYPGTRDPNGAVTLTLKAGETTPSIDFDVQRRNSPGVSSVTVYGYLGQNPVYPAPIVGTGSGAALIAAGNGLLSSTTAVTPGLNVGVLAASGAAVRPGSVRFFSNPYLQFVVAPSLAWAPGPRHLLFSTNDDVYVLPASLLLVASAPPSILSVSYTSDDKGARAALLYGSNLTPSTRIYFDGVQATVVRQNPDGSLLVAPPPGLPGHRANVIAVNGDGQSSLFAQPSGGTAYAYDNGEGVASAAFVSGASMAAGSEAMVEITGTGTSFIDGQTVIGFGSSDIAVRRVWVTGPNRLLANVRVSPGAAPGLTYVTIATGLQSLQIAQGFQVTQAPAKPAVTMIPPVVDAATGSQGASAGAAAVVKVANLPTGAVTITVAGQNATLISATDGQVVFQVPTSLLPGPAVVHLQTAAGEARDVVMNVNPPPPVITGALSGTAPIDPSHAVKAGSNVTLVVSGFTDTLLSASLNAIAIQMGGLDQTPATVAASNGSMLITFTVPAQVAPGPQVPVTVTFGGITTAPFTLPVQ